jgi:uncharacterized protein
MRATRLTILAALILAIATAWGQQSPAAAPATRDHILKLFEVMHIRQQMRSVMEGVMKQQSSLARDTLKQRYPQLTEEEMSHLNNYLLESMKSLPVDSILDDMIPVYQKHLTEGDVSEMITFYSSATGQKLMQEMPAMTSEGLQAAYPRMQQEMEKVMERVEEDVRRKAEPKKNRSPKAPAPGSPDHPTT